MFRAKSTSVAKFARFDIERPKRAFRSLIAALAFVLVAGWPAGGAVRAQDAGGAPADIRISATHSVIAADAQDDGSSLVTLAVILSNDGMATVYDVALNRLIGPMGVPAGDDEPAEILAAVLAPGETVEVEWTASAVQGAFAAGAAPSLLIEADGSDWGGNPVVFPVTSQEGAAQ